MYSWNIKRHILRKTNIRLMLAMAAIIGLGTFTKAGATSKNLLAQDPGFVASKKASAEGKFLLVYYYDTENASEFKTSFDTLSVKLAEAADVVRIDAKNPAESWLVERYRVQQAPFPIVLVVAPNGAVTGSFAKTLPEERLKATLVSPATQECLLGMQQRKLVFVCVQGQTSVENKAAMDGVEQFAKDAKFGNFTTIVKVDPKDARESQLLNRLKITATDSAPQTVLLAPTGQLIANWKGATSKTAIMNKVKGLTKSCGDPTCKDPSCPAPTADQEKGGK